MDCRSWWEDPIESSLIAIDVDANVMRITSVQSLAYRADILTEVAGSGDGAREPDSACD